MSAKSRTSGGCLWTALCRRTGQVVAFAIGDRSADTCARLWTKIPEDYRQCRSFSDFWDAYASVFSSDTHEQVDKKNGETSHMERFHGAFLLHASPAAGAVRAQDALVFEVGADAPFGHALVYRPLQRSRHLISAHHRFFFSTSSQTRPPPVDQPAPPCGRPERSKRSGRNDGNRTGTTTTRATVRPSRSATVVSLICLAVNHALPAQVQQGACPPPALAETPP